MNTLTTHPRSSGGRGDPAAVAARRPMHRASFSDHLLGDLHRRMEARRRKTCPFAGAPAQLPKVARRVEADLVAEVELSEWTREGRMRQPVFLGLRDSTTTWTRCPATGLSKPSVANVFDIRKVSRDGPEDRVGLLAPELMDAVDDGIRLVLDL